MILRPYQTAARDAALRALRVHRSTLIVMPTGTGKSALFGALLSEPRRQKPALVLAHTRQLVEQIAGVLRGMGLQVGVEMADQRRSEALPSVTVASVQSMGKRLDDYPPDSFGLIVQDEAHRSVSFSSIYEHFSPAKLAGFSVGPDSWVELRGGPFGTCWSGPISDAFGMAASALGVTPDVPEVGYLSVFTGGAVESRGWLGDRFGWKAVRAFIEHACVTDVSDVLVTGGRLTLTNEHAVYRATGPIRKDPQIGVARTDTLERGDVLMLDDGANWGLGAGTPFDFVQLAANWRRTTRVRACVDLTGKDLRWFRGAGMDSKAKYICLNAKYGHSLNLSTYLQNASVLPTPSRLYYEGGADGVWVQPSVDVSQWAFVLGFWLGDGWVGGEGQVSFAVETWRLDVLVAELRKMPGIGMTLRVKETRGASLEVAVNNVFLHEFITSTLGRGEAQDKHIPTTWLAWPDAARRDLLRGLMESDGHRGKKGRNVYVTTSAALARTIVVLLRTFGVSAGVHRREPCAGGVVGGRQIVGRHPSFRVHWTANAEAGDNAGQHGTRRRFAHTTKRFIEVPVRGVVPAARPHSVYDLAMDGHPSFVANGVLVHNTATPDRTDGRPLSEVFESVAFQYDIRDAIRDGYLCAMRMQTIYVDDLDLSAVRMKRATGDYNDDDLSKQLCVESALHAVADPLVKLAGTRRTMVFCASVAHARGLSEVLTRYGVMAGSVAGEDKDKSARIEAFKRGDVQFLCSVAMLTEGFDCPEVACVAMARPTKSRSLAVQCYGRGLRLATGKPDCLLLDFTSPDAPVDLACPADVLGGLADGVGAELRKRATKPIDPLLLLPEVEHYVSEETRRALIVAAEFRVLEAGALSPFAILGVTVAPGAYAGFPPGPELVEHLVKAGVTAKDLKGLDRGQAEALLAGVRERRRRGLCTLKTAKWLLRMGLNPDVSFADGGEAMGLFAEYGWRRCPPELRADPRFRVATV